MDHDHAMQLDLLPVDASGRAPMATHVATKAGDWFDPGIWSNGQVPGEGALVHVPAGISVSYAGASDANLFIVRVDGALTVTAPNGTATRMVVDTMISSDTGFLHVDADAPSDGTVDIVFAEGTAAAHRAHYSDTSPGDGVIGRTSWDPEQLSLGLVASGEVKIEGKHVAGHLQLDTGPMAGESQLVFDSAAEGIDSWQPGQTLVVGGSSYRGRDANGHLIAEDEVRTIVSIREQGGKTIVTLDEPLDHDHIGPPDPATGAELTGYVANLSRNVNLSSAAADQNGDGRPETGVSLGDSLGPGQHYVTERAHVMLMHNDNATITNTGFLGLGRTDKSTEIDDFVLAENAPHNHRLYHDANGDGNFDAETDFAIETPADEIMNQRGRYALHIHQAGVGENGHDHGSGGPEQAKPGPLGGGVIGPCAATGEPICHCGDADGDGTPDCSDADFRELAGAHIEGNVVWGSPGWGFVQHSSKADLVGNVAFDVAGSSFVSESGDEIGRWQDNIAIGTYGARTGTFNEDSDDFNEDDGFQGNGFYLKSRAIDVIDNVAVSSSRAGFFYHNNGAGFVATPTSEIGDIADAAPGLDALNTENVPITTFAGNRVIGAFEGIRVATDPSDSIRKYNDAWSVMEDFIGYALEESGVSITYSSKYLFTDFLLIGNDERLYDSTTSGFFFKASVADITVRDSHVEGFGSALYNWTQVGDRQEYRRGFWDPKFPANNKWVEDYGGLESDLIDNPAHNLWNTNVIDLTFDNLEGGALRVPRISFTGEDGTVTKYQGLAVFRSSDLDEGSNAGDVAIELVGDSAGGGLVALWREDIANHPDQSAMLDEHIPLAYADDAYLSQMHLDTGRELRATYADYREGINADIWSGTVLEFAKTDTLGTQVFEYADFAPMNPGSASRDVTTNERIVFSKEMIDGVLKSDGYYTLPGHPQAKFVEMSMIFTDRASGAWTTKTFLVGLDLAWELPQEARNLGTVRGVSDLVVAPEYAFFVDGVQEKSIATIAGTEILRISHEHYDLLANTQIAAQAETLNGGIGIISSAAPDEPEPSAADADQSTASVAPVKVNVIQGTSGADILEGSAAADRLLAADGADIVASGDGDDMINAGRGHDTIDGGAGDDQLWGKAGNDDLSGGAGQDDLRGGWGNDRIEGGAGADSLSGSRGADWLSGGDGDDVISGGRHNDILFGGAGEDRLRGGGGRDRLDGGAEDDLLTGGSQADTFVFDERAGMDTITDFEDGVDAIEFMIQSFGFEDLSIFEDDDDTVIVHEHGSVRLENFDAEDLDEDDFQFSGTGIG